jgi:hypothetical protein
MLSGSLVHACFAIGMFWCGEYRIYYGIIYTRCLWDVVGRFFSKSFRLLQGIQGPLATESNKLWPFLLFLLFWYSPNIFITHLAPTDSSQQFLAPHCVFYALKMPNTIKSTRKIWYWSSYQLNLIKNFLNKKFMDPSMEFL